VTERVTGPTRPVLRSNPVPVERPLTLYLNAQEIVTMMTIGDYSGISRARLSADQNMLKL